VAQHAHALKLVRTQDKVDSESLAYRRMAERWELIHDLLGGTSQMRARRDRWLPRESKETPDAYQARLDRTILYGALRDTIDKLVAKPFSRPVTHRGELPEQLEALWADADWMGTAISEFAAALFRDAIVHGLSHVLVDFPVTGAAMRVDQERAAGVRPYLVHVPAPDLIGWRFVEGRHDELAQIRIIERRVEPEGDYADKEAQYVRVYEPDRWELWRTDGKVAIKVEEGANTLGRVPLLTYYVRRSGPLTAEPPFEDLAWLNLAHWQSLSDQRNIVHYARVPILFGAGFGPDDPSLVLSVNQMARAQDPNARLSWVEHTGASVAAGEQDLKTLEARMEVLGLQPLIEKMSDVTATGRKIDEARMHSEVQAWIRVLESFLRQCLELAGRWVDPRFELPEDFAVDVFNEFSISLAQPAELAMLLTMSQAGKLRGATLLAEAKRRGVLAETVDPEHEAERARQEGPALGLLAQLGAAGGP